MVKVLLCKDYVVCVCPSDVVQVASKMYYTCATAGDPPVRVKAAVQAGVHFTSCTSAVTSC